MEKKLIILLLLLSMLFGCTTTTDEKKQLLMFLPEKEIYLYAHFIEGKTVIAHETFLGEVDLYLEVRGRSKIWLYERALARSEFRLYYGSFIIDDQNHLIVIDYEHGGHGGGSEKATVLNGIDYSVIPKEDYAFMKHEINGDMITFTVNGQIFELEVSDLFFSYKHGNKYVIENNRLIEYVYYYILEGVDMSGAVSGTSPTACFRREYTLRDETICVNDVSFVYEPELYSAD